jgi:hypothetical protein
MPHIDDPTAEAINVSAWPALKSEQRTVLNRVQQVYLGRFDKSNFLEEPWNVLEDTERRVQRACLAARTGIAEQSVTGKLNADEAADIKTRLARLCDTQIYFLYGSVLNAILQDVFKQTGDDPKTVVGTDLARKMKDSQYAYLVRRYHVDTQAFGAEDGLGVLPWHFDGEYR